MRKGWGNGDGRRSWLAGVDGQIHLPPHTVHVALELHLAGGDDGSRGGRSWCSSAYGDVGHCGTLALG